MLYGYAVILVLHSWVFLRTDMGRQCVSYYPHSPEIPFCRKTSRVWQDGRLSEYARDVIVRLRHRPFAQGGMRHCFRMWDMGAKGGSTQLVELVGKRSK